MAKLVLAGLDSFRERAALARGLVHICGAGETSWHGFTCAIVEGLKARGVRLAVDKVVPIRTDEYPTRAVRPLNSRLDLTRLQTVFDVTPPRWETALSSELDGLALELVAANAHSAALL